MKLSWTGDQIQTKPGLDFFWSHKETALSFLSKDFHDEQYIMAQPK